MSHTIQIQNASTCNPFSKYCKIASLANILSVQANNITESKCHEGGFLLLILYKVVRGTAQKPAQEEGQTRCWSWSPHFLHITNIKYLDFSAYYTSIPDQKPKAKS